MERAFGRYPESNILLTNLDKLHSLGWYYKIELNDGLKLYLISIKHKSWVIFKMLNSLV
jgi:hypothetical protein